MFSWIPGLISCVSPPPNSLLTFLPISWFRAKKKKKSLCSSASSLVSLLQVLKVYTSRQNDQGTPRSGSPLPTTSHSPTGPGLCYGSPPTAPRCHLPVCALLLCSSSYCCFFVEGLTLLIGMIPVAKERIPAQISLCKRRDLLVHVTVWSIEPASEITIISSDVPRASLSSLLSPFPLPPPSPHLAESQSLSSEPSPCTAHQRGGTWPEAAPGCHHSSPARTLLGSRMKTVFS